jgi:hypothetical protein
MTNNKVSQYCFFDEGINVLGIGNMSRNKEECIQNISFFLISMPPIPHAEDVWQKEVM